MTTDLKPCGDCAVKPGEPHTDGCDVARCLLTGYQRLSCDGDRDPFSDEDDDPHAFDNHDCGQQVWTGVWPGVVECREFGWWVQDRCAEGLGWVPCDKDAPGATENLNRLYSGEAVWSREQQRWVLWSPA